MVDKSIAQIVTAQCPDCGNNIPLKGALRIGQQVVCPECDAELEVVDTDPVELDWAYDDDFDDQDDA
jgi:alpha-aminoadipate carrier protein LysW